LSNRRGLLAGILLANIYFRCSFVSQVTLWDGSRIPYKPPTTGYNGVYTQTVKMFDVVEIDFILLDAVGISHISLSPCPTDDAEEWIAPTPSPTQAPTLPTALLG